MAKVPKAPQAWNKFKLIRMTTFYCLGAIEIVLLGIN